MNSRAKTQLVLFGLILGLVIIAIAGAGYQTFLVVGEVSQMRLASTSMEQDYGRIASGLRVEVGELNATFLRFAATCDPTDWRQFEARDQRFSVWLSEQKSRSAVAKVVVLRPLSFTLDIQGLLSQVDQAHQQFTRAANEVRLLSGPDSDRRQQVQSLSETQKQLGELLQLASVIGGHGEAIRLFNAGAAWLPGIQHRYVVIAVMLGTVCIGGWLLVVIYRRQLVPLQDQLQETRAVMEKQDKLAHFGELAAGLAHEIRNPLAAINARLFTLERALDEGTAEHEDAVVIRGEIVRLDRIVQDFFRLARPAEPTLEPITAEKTFKGVCDLLQSSLDKESIDLEVDGMTPVCLAADPQQLKQVLINLVKNAAESMAPGGGKITLRAREGRAPLQGRDQPVTVVDVEDTGPGIPPEIEKRLFEPFSSTKQGGTGLGLAISARIVEKHGGVLQYRTRAGKGTTFSIILPKPQKTA